MSIRATVVAFALAGAALFSSAVAGGAAAKPWFWTTAKASRQLIVQNPQAWSSASRTTIARATCRGLEKPIVVAGVRRFNAFRCTVKVVPFSAEIAADPVLWIRIRPKPPGTRICASWTRLGAIDPACLGVRTPAPRVGDPGVCGTSSDRNVCLIYNAKLATRVKLREHFKTPGLDAEVICSQMGSLAARCTWRYEPFNGPRVQWTGIALVTYRKTTAGWARVIELSNIACADDPAFPGSC